MKYRQNDNDSWTPSQPGTIITSSARWGIVLIGEIRDKNGNLISYMTTLELKTCKPIIKDNSPGDIIYGGSSDDTVLGGSGRDIIYGEYQSDYANISGNDYIDGGDEADKLYGGRGDDILIGGAGSDYLEGALGNDSYLFDTNFGQDEIYNYDDAPDRKNIIIFTDSRTIDDFTFKKNGNNLIITAKNNSNNSITIKRFFDSDYYAIDEIQFSDGTVLDLITIKEMLKKLPIIMMKFMDLMIMVKYLMVLVVMIKYTAQMEMIF